MLTEISFACMSCSAWLPKSAIMTAETVLKLPGKDANFFFA